MAEMTVSVETKIDRSPDDSFTWLSDANNLNRWFGGVEQSGWLRKQEEGLPRPEDRFFTMRTYRGKEHTVVHEVDTCDMREYAFEYHTVEGQMPIRARIQCLPSGDGTLCRMTLTAYSDSAVTALAFRLTGWLSRPMMRKQYANELDRARLILETRSD